MKYLLLTLLTLFVLSSCNTNKTINHQGIREWKAGKMKPSNRRPNERPQCIDSW